MEKLTLEHISPYFAYNVKAITVAENYKNPELGIITHIALDGNDDEKICIEHHIGYYLTSIEDTRMYLRSMDLTKPITIDGKEIIPMKELQKIAFAESKRHKLQYSVDKRSFTAKKFLPANVPNQLALFQWLFKNKFDVFNQIGKTAIDADLLEVNPYNS